MTRKEQLEANKIAKLKSLFGDNYKETAQEIIDLFEPYTLYRLKHMKATLKAFHKRNGRIKSSISVEEFKLAANITKGAYLECVGPGVYLMAKTREQFYAGMELVYKIEDYCSIKGDVNITEDRIIKSLVENAKLDEQVQDLIKEIIK